MWHNYDVSSFFDQKCLLIPKQVVWSTQICPAFLGGGWVGGGGGLHHLGKIMFLTQDTSGGKNLGRCGGEGWESCSMATCCWKPNALSWAKKVKWTSPSKKTSFVQTGWSEQNSKSTGLLYSAPSFDFILFPSLVSLVMSTRTGCTQQQRWVSMLTHVASTTLWYWTTAACFSLHKEKDQSGHG